MKVLLSVLLIVIAYAIVRRIRKVAPLNGKTRRQVNVACWIIFELVAILVALLWIIPVINGIVDQFKAENAEVYETEAETEVETEVDDEVEPEGTDCGYRYYNLELQDDGIGDNNFNFGPNPYTIASSSYTEDDGDENVFLLNCLKQEFIKRMTAGVDGDPAFAAAHIAYLDATIGTRVMGSFYDEVEDNWSLAINNARDEYECNLSQWKLATEQYQKTLSAANAEAYLVEVNGKTDTFTVNNVQYTVTDQMYMYPLTMRPDVIVMTQEEDDSDDNYHVLMYILSIKGHDYVMMFKVECGFQPLNVLNIMKGVEPVKKSDLMSESGNSTKKTSSESGSNTTTTTSESGSNTTTTSSESGSDTTTTNSESGSNTTKIVTRGSDRDKKPDNDSGSDTTKSCDQSDSSLTGKDAAPSGAGEGDTKNAGTDTNNGVGATESKLQSDDDSTDYSHEEYVEKVEELAEQTGNDSTPTVEKEPEADVVVEAEVNDDPVSVSAETDVKTDAGGTDNGDSDAGETDNVADNVSDGDAGEPVF